jgi:cell division protease FtsH
MERQTAFNIWYVMLALLAVIWLREAWVGVSRVEAIQYGEFLHHAETGELEEIAIANNVIQARLRKPTPDGRARFVTTRVDPVLARDLSPYDVKFTGVVESTFFRDLLSWPLPALVFFGVLTFLARRMAGQGGMGGLMSIGKSNVKICVETNTTASFANLAGADLANPVDEAALVAAHHEMGHALVAMALPGADPVHKVSIIPRGIGALGYLIPRPLEDRPLMSRGELEDKMAVLLGGRAAEQLVFSRTSVGAADDLARVSDMARSIVTRYGMHEFLPNLSLEQEPSPPLPVPGFTGARGYGNHTPQAIDDAVTGIVAAAFNRVLALLARNREVLERAAALLLERETLGDAELRGLAAQLAPAIGDQDREGA